MVATGPSMLEGQEMAIMSWTLEWTVLGGGNKIASANELVKRTAGSEDGWRARNQEETGKR